MKSCGFGLILAFLSWLLAGMIGAELAIKERKQLTTLKGYTV